MPGLEAVLWNGLCTSLDWRLFSLEWIMYLPGLDNVLLERIPYLSALEAVLLGMDNVPPLDWIHSSLKGILYLPGPDTVLIERDTLPHWTGGSPPWNGYCISLEQC